MANKQTAKAAMKQQIRRRQKQGARKPKKIQTENRPTPKAKALEPEQSKGLHTTSEVKQRKPRHKGVPEESPKKPRIPKTKEKLTPEQLAAIRREAANKAAITRRIKESQLTPEQRAALKEKRAAVARASFAKLTKEQRSAAAKKAAETRRKKELSKPVEERWEKFVKKHEQGKRPKKAGSTRKKHEAYERKDYIDFATLLYDKLGAFVERYSPEFGVSYQDEKGSAKQRYWNKIAEEQLRAYALIRDRWEQLTNEFTKEQVISKLAPVSRDIADGLIALEKGYKVDTTHDGLVKVMNALSVISPLSISEMDELQTRHEMDTVIDDAELW